MNCPVEPHLACYAEAGNFGQEHSGGHNFEDHFVVGHSLAVRPAVVSILVARLVAAEPAQLLRPLQKLAAEPDLKLGTHSFAVIVVLGGMNEL